MISLLSVARIVDMAEDDDLQQQNRPCASAHVYIILFK